MRRSDVVQNKPYLGGFAPPPTPIFTPLLDIVHPAVWQSRKIATD